MSTTIDWTLPEWDLDEFYAPENAGWTVHLVFYEDGIRTRHYGHGSAYSMLPEDLYRGRVPMIPVPRDAHPEDVTEWVETHCADLRRLADDPDPGEKLRLSSDLAEHIRQAPRFVTRWPEADPDLTLLEDDFRPETVEEARREIEAMKREGHVIIQTPTQLLEDILKYL